MIYWFTGASTQGQLINGRLFVAVRSLFKANIKLEGREPRRGPFFGMIFSKKVLVGRDLANQYAQKAFDEHLPAARVFGLLSAGVRFRRSRSSSSDYLIL